MYCSAAVQCSLSWCTRDRPPLRPGPPELKARAGCGGAGGTFAFGSDLVARPGTVPAPRPAPDPARRRARARARRAARRAPRAPKCKKAPHCSVAAGPSFSIAGRGGARRGGRAAGGRGGVADELHLVAAPRAASRHHKIRGCGVCRASQLVIQRATLARSTWLSPSVHSASWSAHKTTSEDHEGCAAHAQREEQLEEPAP